MSGTENWETWEGRVVDGKFPLRKWLGGSNHSAVFLTERASAQKAAIRLIAAGDDSEVQLAHWRAAAQLSHPHLVRVWESGRGQIDNTSVLYLVTEFAEEDLAQILPQRALAPAEAADLLPPLLDALSYLHGKGLVHGRVQPSNVLAVGDQLKLSADHVAPTEDEHTSRRRDIYDAPETAAGIISPAADLWSLGVTLVATLTQNAALADQAERGGPKLPANMPEPFRGIARECLHLDPKRRCTIPEIKARLQPAGRSVPAEPEPVPEPVKASKRGPIMAAVVIAVVIAGFGIVRFFGHSSGNDAPRAQSAADQPAPSASSAPAAASSPSTPAPSTPAPSTSAAPAPAPKNAVPSPGAVVHQGLPDVPQSARNTITGTIKVSVRVEVDASGKVTGAKLTHPGPSKYFARLALEAAQRWEFSPAQAEGQPAASAWLLHFRFKRTSTQASAEHTKL